MDKKTDKILFSPKEGTSGFWGLRDVPEEPNWNLTSLSNDVKKGKYREALESCKSNSLQIVNPTATMLLGQYKSGDIFDLPEGYKLENGGYCEGCRRAGLYHCAHADTCGYAKDVLRLVKTETKEEGTIMPYFKLSKNEYGKMWLLYKPEKDTSGGYTGRYSCWEPINEEFWNEFEKLVPQPETKDFEWKDDMKLFDKKIDVAHIGHGQPEPEESQILGDYNAWPLVDVLKELATAANILLKKHSYDGQRYEEIEICVKRANEIIATIQRKKQ